MRITQDVREYARQKSLHGQAALKAGMEDKARVKDWPSGMQKGLDDAAALQAGLEEKAREFREAGGQIYQKV